MVQRWDSVAGIKSKDAGRPGDEAESGMQMDR